ncbi:hypothetical protein ACVXVO_004666, partial [Vibrio vulnificus]
QVSSSGRCFSDTYSLALEIQSVASINFRASARLGRLAQSAILSWVFRFDWQSSKSGFQNYESFRFSTFWFLFVN